MKKALLTGVSGFAGSHLSELLITKNIDVFGLTHPDSNDENIEGIKHKIQTTQCDILNFQNVKKALGTQKFDYVFHLAALASPAQSFKEPDKTLQNNITGQLNLLEALDQQKSKARILIVGSADEYGNIPPKYLPANEETPLAPVSPYAVSKVAQDMLGLQYFLHKKLQTVRVRPFNHIGPRQSTSFVVASFASQIAKLEKEGGGTMKVGNLNSYRDFTDVRDVVGAYLLALDRGEPGEVYNIGSGKTVKIADILKKLISLSKTKIKVEIDKDLFRPIDIKSIYCDYSKFAKATGWKPQIPIAKTLSDTIIYERSKLA